MDRVLWNSILIRSTFPDPLDWCGGVLNHFGVALSQLIPNIWRILIGVECLTHTLGVPFRYNDMFYTYYLKEHVTENGRYHLFLRPRREHLITELTTHDKGDWQSSYFFARGDEIFGEAGCGKILYCWSNSSKWGFIFITRLLIGLFIVSSFY